MQEKETPSVGDVVIFHDSTNQQHNALVTAVHGRQNPAINLLYTSADRARTDNYGRQIERSSSVCHASYQSAGAFYWRRPEETPNPAVVSTV